MATRRILVTGATGFIGRWSVPALLRRGFEVHGVGSRRSDDFPAELAGARLHRLDLLDAAAVVHFLDALRPSDLLHFAWYAVPGAYWTAPENFDWVAASLHLLRRFHDGGGKRAVLAGTCAEYDAPEAGRCLEGATPTVLERRAAATSYALCKASLQRLADNYARAGGLSLAWGRIFQPYGPYEPAPRLVPAVIGALLRGERALCTPGTQIRDFLYSEDIGEAFAALVDSDIEGATNIGSGEAVSVAEIARMIGRLLDKPALVALGARPAPPGEPPSIVADVTRLRREADWQPRGDLEAGLRKTIDWWRQAAGARSAPPAGAAAR